MARRWRAATVCAAFCAVSLAAGPLSSQPAEVTDGRWSFQPLSLGGSFALASYNVASDPDALMWVICYVDAPEPVLSVALILPQTADGTTIPIDLAVDGRRYPLVGTATHSDFEGGVIPTARLPFAAAALGALIDGKLGSIAVLGHDAPHLDFALHGSGQALRALVETCRYLDAGIDAGFEPGTVTIAAETAADDPIPAEVEASLAAMAKDCADFSPPLVTQPGFLTRTDLNGDGVIDFIANYNLSNCTGFCGSGGCTVTVYVSDGSRHHENQFLLQDGSATRFSCSARTCRLR